MKPPGPKEADVVRLRLARYAGMNAPPKVARKTKAAASAAAKPKEPAMVKKAKREKTTKPARSKAKSKTDAAPAAGVREGSKLAIVSGLLTRDGGCTAKEILAATKWPTVSVPQQAKAAGLKLRKEKDGKVSRYFGTAA